MGMAAQLVLDLFAPRHTHQQRRWERATSEAVQTEVLQLLAARPGEWLGHRDFLPIMTRHDIRSQWGHVLGRLARQGMVQQRRHFYGAERHDDPNYKGFNHTWSTLKPVADSMPAAPEHS